MKKTTKKPSNVHMYKHMQADDDGGRFTSYCNMSIQTKIESTM